MPVRRDILTSAAARRAFIDGVMAMKAEDSEFQPSELGIPRTGAATNAALSTWDLFVLWHWHAMTTATGGGRNGAHRGPVFLAWHRWYLLELEAQIQRLLGDPEFGLPYWDWAADGDLAPASQPASPLWTDSVMGRTNPAGQVTTGAFTVGRGFRVRVDFTTDRGLVMTSRGLRRLPGRRVRTLPTTQQVGVVVQDETAYDVEPWTAASRSGFRNLVEGNIAFSVDSMAELHNRVHVWVGGDMEPPTSPNDPVFFLNHCNVDRLWSSWQVRHPGSGYRPVSGPQTLAFHRRNDPMFRPFWWTNADPAVRPRDMLDVSSRYTYETLV